MVLPLIVEFKGISTFVEDVGLSPRFTTPLEEPEILLLTLPPVYVIVPSLLIPFAALKLSALVLIFAPSANAMEF